MRLLILWVLLCRGRVQLQPWYDDRGAGFASYHKAGQVAPSGMDASLARQALAWRIADAEGLVGRDRPWSTSAGYALPRHCDARQIMCLADWHARPIAGAVLPA